MKSKKDVIEKFEEFNKGAKEIFDLSFKDKLKGSGVSFKWSKSDGILRTELRGPDDETIKAYCNDLRKFIQPNDSLKIEKLTLFYQSKVVDVKFKKMFGKEMSEIYKFLKKSTNHKINGKDYTNQEILDIFLYGKISHRSEKTKDIHDDLSNNILYLSLKNEFINVLIRYLYLINNIVCINNKVLEDLKNDKPKN